MKGQKVATVGKGVIKGKMRVGYVGVGGVDGAYASAASSPAVARSQFVGLTGVE